jgi:hypothetical protein
VADFRGFSEFGLIAGIGVLMTLLSSFVILPPLFLLAPETKREPGPTGARATDGAEKNLSRAVAVFVVAVVGGMAVYGAFYAKSIPFRNNFRELRGSSPATDFLDYVDENLGLGFNPAVFIANSLEDAREIENVAKVQMRKGFDQNNSHISQALSMVDILPKQTAEVSGRIRELAEILDDPKLDRAEKKGGKRAEQLALARRMVKTKPWTERDIPEPFRRRLKTLDDKGYLVLVWPDQRNDADYQAAAWEKELGALSARIDQAGIKHSKADETLIIAWIYRLILKDGGPLLGLAALVVLVFLALDFRSVKRTALVFFPLMVGMAMFVGLIHVLRLELNMFNIIVLPSIIGIGIDNAVHIYHRYENEGPGSVKLVIRTTGMAALLASLTTGIGFGASLVSHNVGLQTMGKLAMLGIGSTFIASTIFFPSLLLLIESISATIRKKR